MFDGFRKGASGDRSIPFTVLQALSQMTMEYKQVVSDKPLSDSELESLAEDGWQLSGSPTAWGGSLIGKLIYVFQRMKLREDLDEELLMLSEDPPESDR